MGVPVGPKSPLTYHLAIGIVMALAVIAIGAADCLDDLSSAWPSEIGATELEYPFSGATDQAVARVLSADPEVARMSGLGG